MTPSSKPGSAPNTAAEGGFARIDRDIAALRSHADEWARLPLPRKVQFLDGIRRSAADVAPAWVAAALQAKGIPGGSPLAGEEWVSGPWAVVNSVARLAETLRAVERTGRPRLPDGAVRTRPDGQVVAEVFPGRAYDRLLFSGIRAEVWMEPGVTADSLPDNMGSLYRQDSPRGAVALVLGAGNVASIAPLDVVYKLYAEGHVVILKMNPVNDYLGPFIERIMAPLVEAGYVRFAYGGADVGEYLASHPGVDEIHMTGSERTHDAIVFGTGVDGAERKRENRPRNPRRMTSELGNVSPTIIVPGPWNEADVRFQAEHIASQKMHNSGFNCIAAQVLVMPAGWSTGPRLLDAVAEVLRAQSPREPYYPGAAQRRQELAARHPGATIIAGGAVPPTVIQGVDASSDDACFSTEAFGPLLATTELPAPDVRGFLSDAIAFCNERLRGTLGANIVIHPATIKELGPAFEDLIADLRYGCIAVNTWTGLGFTLPQATWGAFPGHTLNDIQSGQGVVHNTYLFDRPQRTVLYAPFRPVPRPVWFITNRQAHVVGRRLVDFEAKPGPLGLPGIFAAALRG
jgi:aldehyde dehydrogenase (NAD(P)+)